MYTEDCQHCRYIYAACLLSHTGEAYINCHLTPEMNPISDLLQKSDALFQRYGSNGRLKTDTQYLFTLWKAGHQTIPSEYSPTYRGT